MMSNLGHKTFNNDIKDNDSIFTIKQYLPIYRCNLLCLPSQKYTENLVCIRQVCGYIGVRLMTKTHETPLRNVGTCSSLNQQQIQSAKARYIVTAASACLLVLKREMATPFTAQQQIKERRQYLHHQGKTFVALKAIAEAAVGCTVYGLSIFDHMFSSIVKILFH